MSLQRATPILRLLRLPLEKALQRQGKLKNQAATSSSDIRYLLYVSHFYALCMTLLCRRRQQHMAEITADNTLEVAIPIAVSRLLKCAQHTYNVTLSLSSLSALLFYLVGTRYRLFRRPPSVQTASIDGLAASRATSAISSHCFDFFSKYQTGCHLLASLIMNELSANTLQVFALDFTINLRNQHFLF